MRFLYNRSKQEVLDVIRKDINSNKRYVGDGVKIAGTITEEKIYLNLEDRLGKSSKFSNKVFYGTITENSDTTVLEGKFRLDTYPLVLMIILLCVAIESFIVSFIFSGINFDLIFPVLIIFAVFGYFVLVEKRSKTSNKYIEKYLNSIE